MSRLKGIQNSIAYPYSRYLWNLEVELHRDHEALLEKDFWKTKSRIDWLSQGDIDTKFFHTATINRRRNIMINRLVNHSEITSPIPPGLLPH